MGKASETGNTFPVKPCFSTSAIFFQVISNEPGKKNEKPALKSREDALSSVMEKKTQEERWGKIRDIELWR